MSMPVSSLEDAAYSIEADGRVILTDQLGYLLNAPDLGLDNAFSTWMDDFFTWSVGHLVNLGFSNAENIFQYKANFPIGRMTDPF